MRFRHSLLSFTAFPGWSDERVQGWGGFRTRPYSSAPTVPPLRNPPMRNPPMRTTGTSTLWGRLSACIRPCNTCTTAFQRRTRQRLTKLSSPSPLHPSLLCYNGSDACLQQQCMKCQLLLHNSTGSWCKTAISPFSVQERSANV